MIDGSTQRCAGRVQTPDPSGRRDTYVRKPSKTAMKARLSTVPSHSVFYVLRRRPSSDRKSDARPGGSVPKRGRPSSRSVTHQFLRRTASQQGVPARNRPFRESKGARGGAPKRRRAGGCPSPRAGRPAWSRQTSTPVRRRREATAREKPQKLIQGRRRTPRAKPTSPFRESKGGAHKRSECCAGDAQPSSMPAVWRRGPATGQRTLAV